MIEKLLDRFLTRLIMSRVARKPVFGVSNQVRQKPDCTAIEDGYRLGIPDLESRGIVLCRESKDTDRLRSYRTVDLHLCFRICKEEIFS